MLNRDRLGKHPSDDAAVVVEARSLAGGLYATPAYFNGSVYLLASDDVLRNFAVERVRLSRPPALGTRRFPNPGATPAISGNGARDGTVWVVETKVWSDRADRPSILHAFDAGDVSRELYNSEQNSARDRAGRTVRFVIPTIANGPVYVGVKKAVNVYGLLKSQ